MTRLIYQASPTVTLATNRFINVPTVLQFDDTPLISVVKEQNLGFTSEFPIYHEDGTYLAKVRGTRIFATKDGEKAGIEIRQLAKMTVCTIGERTVFEIEHQEGDAFRTQAELYTPTGYFVRTADAPQLGLIDASGKELTVGGVTMSDCLISGMSIGILLSSDGSCSIGVR